MFSFFVMILRILPHISSELRRVTFVPACLFIMSQHYHPSILESLKRYRVGSQFLSSGMWRWDELSKRRLWNQFATAAGRLYGEA